MTPAKRLTQSPTNEDYGTLCFWHGPFSQWYYSPFEIEGTFYNCAEQYMMASKARMFGDFEAEDAIMKCVGPETAQSGFAKHPRNQQKIGRVVKNFNPAAWNAVCRDFVLRGNLAKFTQNDELFEVLKYTAGYRLVEASPVDRIWGVGLAENNPDAFNPDTWRGTNWLGNILTETRELICNTG